MRYRATKRGGPSARRVLYVLLFSRSWCTPQLSRIINVIEEFDELVATEACGLDTHTAEPGRNRRNPLFQLCSMRLKLHIRRIHIGLLEGTRYE